MEQLNYLEKLDQRCAYVRDRVRGVVSGVYPGFYLYGPPGTAKTFTVRQTLTGLNKPYCYITGHVTPMGLFNTLAENPHETIVLDDVSALFAQKQALQILLAALGHQMTGPRTIKYLRQGVEESIAFTGGIIAISNVQLGHHDPILEALASRVHVCRYDPTNDELAALMREVTAKGWERGDLKLSANEAKEVTDYVIAEASRFDARLDMRLLLDKALPDYGQWREKMTETHWKDLITLGMQQRLADQRHTPLRSRDERKQLEQQLALMIREKHQKIADQIKEWQTATGKSDRAFWRRLKELEQREDDEK